MLSGTHGPISFTPVALALKIQGVKNGAKNANTAINGLFRHSCEAGGLRHSCFVRLAFAGITYAVNFLISLAWRRFLLFHFL